MPIYGIKLAQFRLPHAKYTSAQLSCNKNKNRLLNILPYESTRVPLQPIRGVEGSDYINANFIDSYRDRKAYIATQGPMAKTVEDFWRMIWELNSNIVVMLTNLNERGRVSDFAVCLLLLLFFFFKFFCILWFLHSNVESVFRR
ncbi:unnamed protein product [Trichobilharzia regenti]|nr:unnamed protein product [Trichobilharzia regenti]